MEQILTGIGSAIGGYISGVAVTMGLYEKKDHSLEYNKAHRDLHFIFMNALLINSYAALQFSNDFLHFLSKHTNEDFEPIPYYLLLAPIGTFLIKTCLKTEKRDAVFIIEFPLLKISSIFSVCKTLCDTYNKKWTYAISFIFGAGTATMSYVNYCRERNLV